MDAPSRRLFLALILTQAAHSIEEYVFRLYDVFAPARFISGLFGGDLRTGFAIFNAALVLFGLWCYAARVRTGHPSAGVFAWLWIVIELVNGVGHPAIALARGGYFPGTATAPLLLILAASLAIRLSRSLQASYRESS
jgi:hypothetical protein